MAKSSHTFQKRKRELDKKKKREEKLQKKIDKKFETPATFEEMVTNVDEIQPNDGTDYSETEESQAED
ncbi:MAG: hypothetical protein EP332_07525 [Bacteroidetes bacterium]|nr:MAG: hypothetical protein EP332_07525 [Bacteroidota bacterium]